MTTLQQKANRAVHDHRSANRLSGDEMRDIIEGAIGLRHLPTAADMSEEQALALLEAVGVDADGVADDDDVAPAVTVSRAKPPTERELANMRARAAALNPKSLHEQVWDHHNGKGDAT